MNSRLLESAAFSALLICACSPGAGQAPGNLLGSMPAGHNVYLTFNPKDIGIAEIFSTFPDSIIFEEDVLEEMTDVLGFSPLDWDAWSNALALDPDAEIGIIMDGRGSEIGITALYIPSTDPHRADEYLGRVIPELEEWHGELAFSKSGAYMVVLLADSSCLLDDFESDLDSTLVLVSHLDQYGWNPGLDPVLCMYIDPDYLIERNGLEDIFLSCTTDESILELHIALNADEGLLWFTQMLAPESNDCDISIPSGITGALRISFDMEKVRDFTIEDGLDRAFAMGIEDFGFDSFLDMLACFSGDIHFSLRIDGDDHSGALQFGLEKPEALRGALEHIFCQLAANEDQEMNAIDINDQRCYRIDADTDGGNKAVEFGVLDEQLIISYGYTLRDVINGSSFSSFLESTGMGMPDSGSLVLFTELGPLNVESRLERVMAVLRVDYGFIEIDMRLKTTGEKPFPIFFAAILNIFNDG